MRAYVVLMIVLAGQMFTFHARSAEELDGGRASFVLNIDLGENGGPPSIFKPKYQREGLQAYRKMAHQFEGWIADDLKNGVPGIIRHGSAAHTLLAMVGEFHSSFTSLRKLAISHLTDKLTHYPVGVELTGEDIYPVAHFLSKMPLDYARHLRLMYAEKDGPRLHLLAWVFAEATSREDAEAIIRSSPTLKKFGADENAINRIAMEMRCAVENGVGGHHRGHKAVDAGQDDAPDANKNE